VKLNKYTYNYFLILFSLIPLTIIAGPAVSIINILLIDFSFIILLAYNKKFFFLKNKSIIYLSILYVYLVFNSFISIDYIEGIFRNFGFIRIIILFIAFNYFFQDKMFFTKVFKFWSLVVFIVLIDVLIESFTGTNIFGYGNDIYGGDRIVSFFKDEPIVGGYLNGFYLIILGFLINELKNKNNYLIIILSMIFIISILLTGERSTMIKAFFGTSLFFILYKNINMKKKLIIILTMMILIPSIIFNSIFLQKRFVHNISIIKNKNHNIYFHHYKSGFEVFKNNKFFGVGNKNYRVETCKENKKSDKYICTTHPHQIYFEFLSEHGLIGTLIILLIFYKLIFSKILRTAHEKNYIKIGSLIYLILIFTPIIPSGAFFTDYAMTIFAINLAIFYGSDKKLNIFNKLN
jgi:O-antigen ligase